MTQTYVSLDWRRAPSTSESIGRIQRLLTELDAKHWARVRGRIFQRLNLNLSFPFFLVASLRNL